MKPSEYKKFLEIHSEAARTESKEAAAWDVALEMFGLVEFPGEETQPITEEKKSEKPKAKRTATSQRNASGAGRSSRRHTGGRKCAMTASRDRGH